MGPTGDKVETLLYDATESVNSGEWPVVAEKALEILAIAPQHADALDLLQMAQANGGGSMIEKMTDSVRTPTPESDLNMISESDEVPSPPTIAVDPPDPPNPLDPIDELIDELIDYSVKLRGRKARALATLVSDYASRVKQVDEGELPPAMSAPPRGLTPELVGNALGESRYAGVIEAIRNFLIFTPVLWTWFEFGRASRAYGEVVSSLGKNDAVPSLLVLWENGFKDYEGITNNWGTASLTTTAWVAVGLLLTLVITSALLGFVRAAGNRNQARRSHSFAATLARAEAVGAMRGVDTPEVALQEFFHVTRELATNLKEVGASQQSTATTFEKAIATATTAMTKMSESVDKQALQFDEVKASLADVAQIGKHLDTLATQFKDIEGTVQETARALGDIRNDLGDSAPELVSAVKELSLLAEKTSRASDIFTAAVTGVNKNAELYEAAGTTMNQVSIRIIEALDLLSQPAKPRP